MNGILNYFNSYHLKVSINQKKVKASEITRSNFDQIPVIDYSFINNFTVLLFKPQQII